MRVSDEWTTKTNCKPVPLILLISLWKEKTLEREDNGYPICVCGALRSYDLWVEDDDWIVTSEDADWIITSEDADWIVTSENADWIDDVILLS